MFSAALDEQVSVIVVGAGFAGLACAIDCHLKGHHVILFEKFRELKSLGDVISFGTNAGRIFERWGLHDRLWPLCTQHETLVLHNYKGDVLLEQFLPTIAFGSHSYNGNRGQLHQIILDHAQSLGIEIKLGFDVQEYWENEAIGKAGVVVNGERFAADLVVAADGVRSKGRSLILGYDDKPKSSGYAIYRAWFNPTEAGVQHDPLSAFMVNDGDAFHGWIGKDVHFLASTSQGGKAMSWVITHKDEADIEESWSFPGKMEDVLKVVDGWDPRCAAILSKAPSCVDWKLVYRDPLPTWISKEARLVVIGDAAHPFLPTSIQGASQAVEDGVVLATLLKLAGKGDIALAVRAWEYIRYSRVRRAQLTGETTRDRWHKSRSDASEDEISLPRPEWLLGFDCEVDAQEKWPSVSQKIKGEGYKLPLFLEERVNK